MKIIHNSYELQYRTPFGAVRCGSTIELGLDMVADSSCQRVYAVVENEGKSQERIRMSCEEFFEKRKYKCIFTAPEVPGLTWYYFEMERVDGVIYYGNNEKDRGGLGMIYHSQPRPYQITVYPKDYHTPDWFKKSVVYQIFVDRFFNGNDDKHVNNPKPDSFIYSSWDDMPMYIREDKNILRWEFFGGNLLGIIKKLDYLKELGVGALYLNPIFEARSNHKYDTGDYKKIDPMFGDNELFKELCIKAKEKGIAIILDGVFSHTGADSVYFNRFGTYPTEGACQSQSSPYYPWYTFNEYPDQYECWWGIGDLPNVNELEPSYLNFIVRHEESVVNQWMNYGCKGWRLDVADELPDEFIEQIRSTIKHKDPQSVLIGEVWEDASNKISYGTRKRYLTGGLLDSTTNYPLRNAIIDFVMGQRNAAEFDSLLMNLYENYPKESFYAMLNMIGGHDVPRILSILSGMKADCRKELNEQEFELAVKRLKLAALLQMTLPGVPCIYYGDEAGCMGFDEPKNRGTYPWGKENRELLGWYKKLAELRNCSNALKTGSWRTIYASQGVLAFVRYIKDQQDAFGAAMENDWMAIIVNTSFEASQENEMDVSFYGITRIKSLFEDKQLQVINGKIKVNIEGLGYKILCTKFDGE